VKDHIAILNKKYKALESILSGKKTIESRWYKTKKPPWNRIDVDDTVYFKESGGKVKAKAVVTKVLQFVELNEDSFNTIVSEYGNGIQLKNKKYNEWYEGKKYCLLVFFKDVEKIKEPFSIDKSGFGIGAAWLTVDDIDEIKL
jgi:ASC-1-like (ASCH) protein